MTPTRVKYFKTPADLRRWLEKHHATAKELWVGLYKRSSGKPSVTWPDVVDESLCFGWIDGIRKSIDAERFTNRITPRRPGSNWSAINIKRVKALEAEGRMTPAGRAAFKKRSPAKSGVSSYENRPAEMPAALAKTFQKERAAWRFFQSQPPGYRKLATWFVVSAKTDETRSRRLARLIEASAQARRL